MTNSLLLDSTITWSGGNIALYNSNMHNISLVRSGGTATLQLYTGEKLIDNCSIRNIPISNSNNGFSVNNSTLYNMVITFSSVLPTIGFDSTQFSSVTLSGNRVNSIRISNCAGSITGNTYLGEVYNYTGSITGSG